MRHVINVSFILSATLGRNARLSHVLFLITYTNEFYVQHNPQVKLLSSETERGSALYITSHLQL